MRSRALSHGVLATLFGLVGAAHTVADEPVPTKCGVPIERGGVRILSPGEGELQASLEAGLLRLRVTGLMVDILGFEHPATLPQEQKAVVDTTMRLKDQAALFQPSEKARCQPAGVQYESALLPTVAPADSQTAAQAPTQSGQGVSGTESITEKFFYATFLYRCAAPDQLRTLNVGWFKQFPKVRHLQTQYQFARHQGEAALTPVNAQLSW